MNDRDMINRLRDRVRKVLHRNNNPTPEPPAELVEQLEKVAGFQEEVRSQAEENQ